MTKMLTPRRLAAAAALALATALPASAETAEEFYRGKQVRLVIGYASGSGYDLYARFLARHMGKHIPGAPAVIAQNMDGAGSLRAANWINAVAPKDGTAFAGVGSGIPMTPLLGGKGATFHDDKAFTWIGSMNNEVSVCVAWHTAGINTIDEAKTKEMLTGATALGVDDTTVFPAVANAMLGTKFKWITGYRSGNEMNLAMERGETQGRCGWAWSSVKATHMDWYKGGQIRLLMQMSLAKHPDLPDLPLIVDLAHTAEQRQVLELIFSRQVLGRPFLAPPGLPADRTSALRTAFDATMKDPEFLAEAEKSQIEINHPVGGEEAERFMARMYAFPRDVVDLAVKITPQPQAAAE
ncbi:MAG: Bug family tripartite tricarboxylate transporter substrate binding protein [Gemmatimonas sp.]